MIDAIQTLPPLQQFALAFLAILVIVAIVNETRKWRARKSHRRAAACARIASPIVEEHIAALSTRRRKLTGLDAYGTEIGLDKWREEILYFVRTKILPACTLDLTYEEVLMLCAELQPEIEARIDGFRASVMDDIAGMSGEDFEHYCAQELRKAGWRARVTTLSGDQGADIVAERTGAILVVQCKHHSAAVGNKAVQEVASARQFYGAHHAVVIASSGFSASARKLAEATRVRLLTPEEIAALQFS